MTEPASAKPRTWRPMAGWSLVVLCLAGLGMLATYVYHDIGRTRAVLRTEPVGSEKCAAALEELGGPEKAVGRISLYLRMPRLTEDDIQYSFILLSHCRRPAVGLLARSLQHGNSAVRDRAAWALGVIGPDAADAVPALASALADKDEAVGFQAANSLAAIGPGARAAVPALTASLDRLCARAAHALGHIGPDSAPAVPGLTKALASAAGDFREEAARALGSIGPTAKVAAPDLRKLLKDRLIEVRLAAAQALGELACLDATGVEVLSTGLGYPEWEVRRDAARALREVGPAGKPAVPALEKALEDKHDAVRVAAAAALVRMGAASPAAKATLIWGVRQGPFWYGVRPIAASALGEMGPAAKDAIPDLERMLGEPPLPDQAVAAEALKKIIGEEPPK